MKFYRIITTLFYFFTLQLLPAMSFSEVKSGWSEVGAVQIPDYASGYPDVSQYNGANIQKLLDAVPAGLPKVNVERMFEVRDLADFTAGERAAEWVKRQRNHPVSIVVQQGKVTLSELYKLVGNPDYLEKVSDSTYLLRLPLVILQGAALVLDGATDKEILLSSERGAFIANAGNFFALGARVTGWSEAKNQPAFYVAANLFRPFYVSWEGSQTYLFRATFSSLGYEKSKSYGFTLSRHKEIKGQVVNRDFRAPTGWLVESTFEDVYYGFYCYEAEDVVIYKNTYKNNIVYGIDPHDRSERLIIVKNEVYGTKKKHGIIISREVNHSWILDNRSHHNQLSGVVLDRSCEGNHIAFNELFENGADGITFYESSNNIVFKNAIYANKHHGIRVRNSLDISLVDNDITANGRLGVLGLKSEVAGENRNIEKDPFEVKVGVSILGGLIAANGSGSLKFDTPERLFLQAVKLRHPIKTSNVEFSGFLAPMTASILAALASEDKALLFLSGSDDSNHSTGRD